MPGDPRAPASRRESRGTEAAGDCGGSNDGQLIDDGAVVGPAPAILEAVRVYTAARPLQPPGAGALRMSAGDHEAEAEPPLQLRHGVVSDSDPREFRPPGNRSRQIRPPPPPP